MTEKIPKRIVKPYYVSDEECSFIIQAYTANRARLIAAIETGEKENYSGFQAKEVRLCLPLTEREIGSEL